MPTGWCYPPAIRRPGAGWAAGRGPGWARAPRETAAAGVSAAGVVLSACNAAAGGSEGAEALSGLARAFFYAGARALLVSHWAVYSTAATEPTTKTLPPHPA